MRTFNASEGLVLAVVLATACADPTATPSGDTSSTSTAQTSDTTAQIADTTSDTTAATSETSTASTADTTTTEVDPCAACDPTQLCVDDACVCNEGLFENPGKCVDRILFALPMDNPDASVIGEVIGFDNDPEVGESDLDCLSYDGEPFPRCYDDHTGTDFLLRGGFTKMDNGSADVFAAADGEVVFVHDGEYDRCALNLQAAAVQCEDGGPVTPSNEITVLHPDGLSTRYLHLMKNSIVVADGDLVTCGQPMAKVGSSGNSSAPHLHFEVLDLEGNAIDAFAGRYSHPETYWAEQNGVDELPGAACQ